MKRVLIYFSILATMLSCGSPRKVSSVASTNPYSTSFSTIHPQFIVYHPSDEVSELHFKISSKELLYTRSDGINLSSNVLISYLLFSSMDSKIVIDSSSSKLIDINNNNSDKFLVGKLTINTRSPSNFFLKIRVLDINRNVAVYENLIVEKEDDLVRQNFILKSEDTDVPLFRNYVKLGESVSITYQRRAPGHIYVRYYDRDFPLAKPPFSTSAAKPFQYQEDSLFILKASADGSIKFSANKKGFYHFQIDTTSKKGFTLFNYSETFPKIMQVDDMLPPMRYITSNEEYTEISNSQNKKEAIDKFWLNSTSNKERSRQLIKEFYNRVQDANQFFSSYIEGWRTDRGMIYLIYGAPKVNYKTANTETWEYGEKNNVNSLSYTFVRVNNPFTDNDYILERSDFYKQSWYMAVDVWRQGKVYLSE